MSQGEEKVGDNKEGDMAQVTEFLSYDDYRYEIRRASYFDSRVKIHEQRMRCPRCRHSLAGLRVGESQVCECGLELKLCVNGLRCTGEVPDEALVVD